MRNELLKSEVLKLKMLTFKFLGSLHKKVSFEELLFITVSNYNCKIIEGLYATISYMY